jgi:hypothetical protein
MDKLAQYLPEELRRLGDDRSRISRITTDWKLTAQIESAVREISTGHDFRLGHAGEANLSNVAPTGALGIVGGEVPGFRFAPPRAIE